MGVGVTAATGLLTPLPASALFGIGEDPKKEYNDMTLKLVGEIKAVLVLEKDDPKKPEAVVALRKEMNSWVARYVPTPKFVRPTSLSPSLLMLKHILVQASFLVHLL